MYKNKFFIIQDKYEKVQDKYIVCETNMLPIRGEQIYIFSQTDETKNKMKIGTYYDKYEFR